jgi:hypothetical protein
MKRMTPIAACLLSVLLLTGVGCAKQPTIQSPAAPHAQSVAPAESTPSVTDTAVAVQKPVPAEVNPPGDIPDNQAFVPYKTTAGFSVKVPEGWSRTNSADSVEFTDKLNTIHASWTPAAAAPTVASVKSTDVLRLQSSEAAFKLEGVKAVSLPAGPAVRTTYQANSAANPVTGKQYRLQVERYTLFKNGTRVDLTLLSPVGADNVDPWKIVKESVTWK